MIAGVVLHVIGGVVILVLMFGVLFFLRKPARITADNKGKRGNGE